MALFAAARRAASPLLLADVDAAARHAASPLLLADAARRAASPLLLADAATTMTTTLASVTPILSVASKHDFLSATAEHRPAATSLLLTGAAATTTTPRASVNAILSTATQHAFRSSTSEKRTAATSLLFTGAYSLRPASTAILGRRALFPACLSYGTAFSPATLHRRAPRCFSTDATALTPEVQSVLQRMEDASAKRHDAFLKELEKFEVDIMANYSTAKLSSAEKALTAGKVAWRVSTAVLAFGVTTLVAVLQTVKDGWKKDFEGEVKLMLENMMGTMKIEILALLRPMVRKEIDLIEAEKASKK